MSEVTFALKELSGLGRELEIKAPAAVVDSDYRKDLAKLAKDVSLPGFRKGKVPVNIIEKRYGTALKNETIQRLIGRLYEQYVKDNDLHVLEWLEAKKLEVEEPGAVGYAIQFELIPELNLEDLKQITVQRYHCEIGEEEIGQGLHNMQEHMVSYEPSAPDYAAYSGDKVTFSVTFTDESGEHHTDAKMERILGKVGVDSMTSQWLNLLNGAKVGEQRSGEFIVAGNCYEAGKLAGQRCKIEAKVESILVPHLPELNDEFAKRAGVKDLEELRANVQKELRVEADERALNLMRDEAVEKILEARWQRDPELSIDRRVQERRRVWEERHANSADGATNHEEFPESMVRDYIVKEMRKAILVRVYGEKHPIEVTDDDMQSVHREHFRQMIMYGFEAVMDFYEKTKDNKNYWNSVRQQAAGRKLLNMMVDELSIEEKETSYKELTKLDEQRKEQNAKRDSEVRKYVE